MSDITYLLAGSERHARRYAVEAGFTGPAGPRPWRYIPDPQHLRGLSLKPSQVLRTYGYDQRTDVVQFEQEILLATQED